MTVWMYWVQSDPCATLFASYRGQVEGIVSVFVSETIEIEHRT